MAKKNPNPKKDFQDLLLTSKKDNQEVEKLLSNRDHVKKDHYHGKHHFDKKGHHDDVQLEEFSLKQLFKVNKKMVTFRLVATAMLLALAIALSALDTLLEHVSLNVGGVAISMRVFDLTIIVLGLPVAGFYGTIFVALIEPWFHWLIDSDHLPLQVVFDSINYILVVVAFFLIFFAAFKNSPIHKETNKTKFWVKKIVPGTILVPILSLLFAATFILALAIGVVETTSGPNYLVLFFVAFGLQLLRFLVIYILFVLVENKLKPLMHRYQ